MRNTYLRFVDAGAKLAVVVTLLIVSGCSIIQSQTEVPSLENQLNRIVSGLDAVRTNEVIASMPISSDAKWPAALSEDRTEENEKLIKELLQSDPYIATHDYTDASQMEVLGGLYTPGVGELVFSVMNRLLVLYGLDAESSTSEWPQHWPSAFSIGSDFSSYNVFENGGTPKRVEAISGNVYQGYAEAVIALMPTNFQKDLTSYKSAMDDSLVEVAKVKAKVGQLETRLETDPDENGNPLSEMAKASINAEIETLETELEQKEAIFDENEEIYLSKLDEAVEVLKSDISLDEEQVNLARNIAMAASAVYSGAADAGLAFTLSLANLTTKDILNNFPNELASLSQGKRYVPRDKFDLFEKRYAKIAENGLFALPAIAVGSYYAVQQVLLAGKYEDIAEVILDADEARREAQLAMTE